MGESSDTEFSYRRRAAWLQGLSKNSDLDLLVIGGGITGVAVARDAATRGLKVAVVERGDFALGTSSKSSKLIHGGLRYLENLELHLVFEALKERAFLLESVPHLVRPLEFYLPVYQGSKHPLWKLGMGLWMYDLLTTFKAPHFHKRLSPKKLKDKIPGIQLSGLNGGFSYPDASMWDDVLTVETAREAARQGASLITYCEARQPIWDGDRIAGFTVKDRISGATFDCRAKQVVLCVGPWTDLLGKKLSPTWTPKLKPSRGVHLVFDWKRIPLPGTLVMTHPVDGRISFAMPRPELGAGVTLVGTTDGPTDLDPEKTRIDAHETSYLIDLLRRFLPGLNITQDDLISQYVGVRPLVAPEKSDESLQKVSREHSIEEGPGGVVWVAGGKYTTHRLMAQEIVDFALEVYTQHSPLPATIRPSNTRTPVCPNALVKIGESLVDVPESLRYRFGAEARAVLAMRRDSDQIPDEPGFEAIEAQLRFEIAQGMVVRLEDFYYRRTALALARRDHGLPWLERLAKVYGEELALSPFELEQAVLKFKSSLGSLVEDGTLPNATVD